MRQASIMKNILISSLIAGLSLAPVHPCFATIIEFAASAFTIRRRAEAHHGHGNGLRDSVSGWIMAIAGTSSWNSATAARFHRQLWHVEFMPSETNKTFTVQILDDGLVEDMKSCSATETSEGAV